MTAETSNLTRRHCRALRCVCLSAGEGKDPKSGARRKEYVWGMGKGNHFWSLIFTLAVVALRRRYEWSLTCELSRLAGPASLVGGMAVVLLV